ncbi:T9SS type A sorting domain-containing protein [Marinifilum caeruleilacunae]|uniref:T9SS type A sorting domain-containing protein n=1 Tax=Marinifilum caeruleilacunae TaxID=2499076 RepID=A0ABX1WRK5_9BACT|nr:T9SS type A sorting domain-containing protein [Marinifilum caeruleilacunae]NOU58720.1 T9SS type A sorting domain-containing protein [Marinifilum caeruleilacunae]
MKSDMINLRKSILVIIFAVFALFSHAQYLTPEYRTVYTADGGSLPNNNAVDFEQEVRSFTGDGFAVYIEPSKLKPLPSPQQTSTQIPLYELRVNDQVILRVSVLDRTLVLERYWSANSFIHYPLFDELFVFPEQNGEAGMFYDVTLYFTASFIWVETKKHNSEESIFVKHSPLFWGLNFGRNSYMSNFLNRDRASIHFFTDPAWEDVKIYDFDTASLVNDIQQHFCKGLPRTAAAARMKSSVLNIENIAEETASEQDLTGNPGTLKVYPNPTDGEAYIEFPNPKNTTYQLQVVHAGTSSVVYSNDQVSGNRVIVDRKYIQSSGLYIIILRGEQTYKAKLIVK